MGCLSDCGGWVFGVSLKVGLGRLRFSVFWCGVLMCAKIEMGFHPVLCLLFWLVFFH